MAAAIGRIAAMAARAKKAAKVAKRAPKKKKVAKKKQATKTTGRDYTTKYQIQARHRRAIKDELAQGKSRKALEDKYGRRAVDAVRFEKAAQRPKPAKPKTKARRDQASPYRTGGGKRGATK